MDSNEPQSQPVVSEQPDSQETPVMVPSVHKHLHLTVGVGILFAVLVLFAAVIIFRQSNEIKKANFQNDALVVTYPALADKALWLSQLIKSNTPLRWQVPNSDLIIQGANSTFYCGEKLGTFYAYSSHRSRNVGDGGSVSVIDCGDVYFVYDYGDAGPKLAGPFGTSSSISLVGQDSSIVPDDWKPYRSDKYGFEFKYPPEYVIGEDSGGTSSNDIQILVTRFDQNNEPVMDDRVFVLKNLNWDAKDLKVADIISAQHFNEPIVDYREQQLNGYIIARFHLTPLVGGARFEYAVISDGVHNVVLQFNPIAAGNADLINGFISVFRFISQPEIDTSTWKTYRNERYGFEVALPESWRGFKIAETRKDIYGANGAGEKGVVGRFPAIEIIHPLSTVDAPWQNIPIYVFTQEQWKRIANEKEADWSVGAAPIPPSILGQNSTYVFALPARYNYAYQTGWEEVQQIMDRKPLTVFEPAWLAPVSSWNSYRNEEYGTELKYPKDVHIISKKTSTGFYISDNLIDTKFGIYFIPRPLGSIIKYERLPRGNYKITYADTLLGLMFCEIDGIEKDCIHTYEKYPKSTILIKLSGMTGSIYTTDSEEMILEKSGAPIDIINKSIAGKTATYFSTYDIGGMTEYYFIGAGNRTAVVYVRTPSFAESCANGEKGEPILPVCAGEFSYISDYFKKIISSLDFNGFLAQ